MGEIKQPEAVSSDAQAIDQVIKESQERLSATTAESPIPVKRPRGRPRKDGKPPQPSAAAPSSAQSVEAKPAPSFDLTPQIAGALKVIGAGFATHLECEKIALTDAEADPIAMQVNECLKIYLPKVEESPNAPLWVLLATVGMTVAMKTKVYFDDKADKARLAARANETPAPQPQSGLASVFPVTHVN